MWAAARTANERCGIRTARGLRGPKERCGRGAPALRGAVLPDLTLPRSVFMGVLRIRDTRSTNGPSLLEL